MIISVIIPNLNSPTINEIVKCLNEQPFMGWFEIIIVGRDDSKLIQEDERVQFIQTPYPVNPATARNIGIRKSNIVAACFYLVAIVFSLIPFFMSRYDMYYHNYYYLAVVLITDIMLIVTSLQLLFKKDIDMKIHRKFTLIAIFVGLIAFLLGAFVG